MASLTKEELKTALINHGLSPPPASARKDEFLAMYEEHVAPVDREAGEFSSDDEVTLSPKKKLSQSSAKSNKSNSSATKSPKKGGKGKSAATEEDSLVVGDLNLDDVDDDKLFELLKENGISPGPIVDSTRPFYKKKLALVLRGENGVMNGTSNGDFSDTEPEDEPQEDEQPSAVTTPQERRTSTRSKVSSSSKKSLVTSPASGLVTSGMRKRFNMTVDDLDSSRNTPTPRRSIHTYKVSESTKQTITRSSDGNETRDTVHIVERSESKGETENPKSSFFSLKKILLLLMLLALVAAIVFFVSKQKGGDFSVDRIVSSVKNSLNAPEAAEAPAPPTRPPPRDIPEQAAQADV